MHRTAAGATSWTPGRARLLAALVVVGVALRVVRFAHDPSLYSDALALDAIDRSWSGFLDPLTYVQAAPPLHLALVMGAVRTFGTSEAALRIVPMLGGCGAVALFALWARRALAPAGALAATALVCTAWRLVDYSALEKHYATDVCVAAAALVLFDGRSDGRPWPRALFAALAPLLSFPSLFVVTPLAFAEIASRRGARARALRTAALLAPFAAATAFVVFVWTPHTVDLPAVLASWRRDFAPAPLSVEAASWYVRHAVEPAWPLVSPPDGLVAGPALLAVVAWHVARSSGADRRRATLLAAPVALAFVAAVVQRYPFSHRSLLFAAPCVAGLFGAAVDRAVGDGTWPARVVRRFAVYVVASSAAKAAWTSVAPPSKQDMRSVVARVAERVRPGDAFVASFTARSAFVYYARRHAKLGGREVVAPAVGTDDVGALVDAMKRRTSGRVWFVASIAGREDAATRDAVAGELGPRRETLEAANASAYLWGP